MLRCLSVRRLCVGTRRPPPSPGLDTLDLKRYTYVDKSHLLARILSDDPLHSAGKYLHAPAMRRIGKSTTVKMLASMARGDKVLFEGMAINDPKSPFVIGERPFSVIQLDFSGCVRVGMSIEEVERSICWKLCRYASAQHQISIPSELRYPAQVLSVWLDELRAKECNPIVLLIDEYDAPVTCFLPEDIEKAQEVAMMLKPFYETIKSYGEYFHKVFVTGVSKFSSTSMFSGPNQFLPLMEDTPQFCGLYGFSDIEIRQTYGNFIEHKFNAPLDEIMGNMRRMYNGYRVHPLQKNEEMLYNPWSVLKYLYTRQLTGHWAKSAGSASVMSMLGLRAMNIIKGFEITQDHLFSNISAKEYNTSWQQMSFQSGYASIKTSHYSDEFFDAKKTPLQLAPPNEEVREYLESGMVDYIGNIANPTLLSEYRRNLFELEFGEACKSLEILIRQQSILPSNETEFAAFALYSLLVHNVTPSCMDIAFEKGVRLSDEVLYKGKYPTFDGAILFRSNKSIVLLVIELKYNAGSGIQQMNAKRYASRARKLFQERNMVAIDTELSISLNLSVSASGEIRVSFENLQ